jgi:signal transduction histidine kinase
MFSIGKIKYGWVINSLTLIVIVLIGILDFLTGPELSFSFFYLFPIAFLALYKGSRKRSVILCSLFASILWFLAEYFTRSYSNFFYPVWNGFVRLVIFTSIGLLLVYLREKEKKLREANYHLKELNDEKNRMIGIAAHDLRSPISGVYSLISILTEENRQEMNDYKLELLGLMKSMCENSLGVLKNLLDVSKIESGKIELNLEEVNYETYILQHIRYNQLLANRKGITIKLESEPDVIRLSLDKNHFSEVIDNLLSNAIKFSPNGGEIIVRISRKGDNRVLTEVIDHGMGIR